MSALLPEEEGGDGVVESQGGTRSHIQIIHSSTRSPVGEGQSPEFEGGKVESDLRHRIHTQ